MYKKSQKQIDAVKEEANEYAPRGKTFWAKFVLGSINKKKTVKEPKYSSSTIDEVFVSGRVQKQKAEIKKMALEKRKQYGRLIQKQVLKMHKKKNQGEEEQPVQRLSQGSKHSKIYNSPEEKHLSVFFIM